MYRKFQFVNFKSPSNLTLTKAKKIMGKKEVNKLEVGQEWDFQGYGNGINFIIKRIK